ncbi:MAG: family 10 glycosylhydrolase [Firmicutes bacterium]|nr:family 10 glycosylhydrolase [Bacillota bacterium]
MNSKRIVIMLLSSTLFILFVLLVTLNSSLNFFNFFKIFAFNREKEVRAVWIATVHNLDWPKTRGIDQQKKEMKKNLDLLKSVGINRVYFQVRCRSDAMYDSKMFPWSQWLAGEIGVNPGYDPLLFMKDECSKRNIDLEAWVNPFLLKLGKDFDINKYISTLPDSNPLKFHPEWIIKCNDNDWFMLNPGIPEVRELVINEIAYIVEKYELDIHVDDYFYPYPPHDGAVYFSFVDDKNEYEFYGNGLSVEDFRRENLNKFVEELHKVIKNINPKISFSISPFSIWKNSVKDGGCGTKGMESYNKIFTDTVKWVKNGWVDSIVPQIYWHIGFENADYKSLVTWWDKIIEGTNVELIIGQAGYKLDPNSKIEPFRSSDEILKQINVNRKLKNVKGNSIFSLRCIKNNVLDIRDKLKCSYDKFSLIL